MACWKVRAEEEGGDLPGDTVGVASPSAGAAADTRRRWRRGKGRVGDGG